jgi:23S rRNA (guanosine2251-2'-O)-methyltransferase
MQNKKIIYGFHSIISMIRSNPTSIKEIFLDESRNDGRMQQLIKAAEEKNIKFHFYSKSRFDQLLPKTKHQGVLATVSHQAEKFFTLEDIVENDHDTDPIILILDGVEDPHNLGACFRVADAMGVSAIVTPKDNAVGINATVRNVACGATETVPFVTVTNLKRAINYLKQNHFFIIGTEQETKNSLYKADLKGSIAIIMGSEGSGMRRLTRESCDLLITIPMLGSVESLNVSVATGICLSEIQRQRQLP